MTWATRITIFRLFLVPVFAALVVAYQYFGQPECRWMAFGLFTLAAVSDYVDGYLARHYNQQSELGAILDPIADKCLLLAALLTMGLLPIFWKTETYTLPTVFSLLILGRDSVLLAGFLILYRAKRGHVVVQPHWTGKFSTLAAFMAIGAVLLDWSVLVDPLCWIGGVLAIACTLVYIPAGLQQLRHGS
jgi:CDP-diacylglycerol--glycerol-3-phosphate 3-phosphatidyltransferase/cardiolipin synthase